MEFEIGDRVKAIKPHDGKYAIVGVKGTIREILEGHQEGKYARVEYDDNVGGHNLGGVCEDGYGWDTTLDCLEPLSHKRKLINKHRKLVFEQ